LDRYRAQSLLKKSMEAQAFFNQMMKVSTECKQLTSGNEDVSVNLWERISARIESEQYAASLIRKDLRQHSGPLSAEAHTSEASPSFISRLYNPQIVFGGLSGAVMAALALIVFTRPSQPGEILTVARSAFFGFPQGSSNSGAGGVTQVSTGASRLSRSSLRYALNQMPTVNMEVDWMRAKGPLSLIQNPQGKSAIIWVRRKSGAIGRGAPVASPTSSALLGQGLDASRLNSSK
jgi:hypothetical protein